MIRIQRIEFYICIIQVIFQYFGTLAAKVSINQNITGLLGNKDTHLTCSFFLEKGEQIFSVHLFAKKITEDFDDNNHIAIFEPEKAARILQPGNYLSRRVTLTNITNISTNATLLFHVLQYTDEKDYMCKFLYYDMVKVIRIRDSDITRISVKVQVRDVHIKHEPNQKQHDEKTDNITLTCEANGNPEPSYKWFKENSNRSILSTTDLYVIEDVVRNNSGVYICQAYNTIDNIIYSHSTSVEIDIVDEILSQSESVSTKVSAASYAVPIFIAVGLIGIILAVIYRKYCSKQAQIEKNKESRWQNMVDCFIGCCTEKPDYTPVVRNNNTNTVAPGDASNCLTENKISYRNKEVDIVKTVGIIQHMPTASGNIYAEPKDTLPAEIVKDGEKYDNGASNQSAVYAEVIDQANMDSKMSNSP